MGIILAILVFGLIVTIHELGQFFAGEKEWNPCGGVFYRNGSPPVQQSSRRYKVFDQTASNRRLLYDGRR